MAERFTGQRCQDCQGGLVYVKAEKYWECPYCGKIYERELRFNKVQIDGLAGINDLVRSTLSRTSALDFKDAENDLEECEKINHQSVGTLIAEISFYLFKSFFTKERQQMLAKVNLLVQKMNREFPTIEDEEEILYEYIDSSDIYAFLAVIYGTTGQRARLEAMYERLDVNEVYNQNITRFLLSVFLKDGKIEDADVLLRNIHAENCRAGIITVLKSYPANEKKAAHISYMLSHSNSSAEIGSVFDSYFETTDDPSSVTVDIFLVAVEKKVNFNTAAVIAKVFERCTDSESAAKIFDSVAASRIDEKTADIILDWCLLTSSNLEISSMGMRALFESSSVFELEVAKVISLLKSGQSENEKVEKLKAAIGTFRASNKAIDELVSFALLENFGRFEYRRAIFDVLAERADSIRLSTLEAYIISSTKDGAHKPEMIEALFAKTKNLALCTGLFAAYVKANTDTPEIREEVMLHFLNNKIYPDPNSFSVYLLNANELHSDKILGEFINAKCKPLSTTFDNYVLGLPSMEKYNPRIAAIATSVTYTVTTRALGKYLLGAKEPGTVKVTNFQKHMKVCSGNLRDAQFTVTVAGQSISGNIAQIYLLVGKDEAAIATEIISLLKAEKIKLDAPLESTSDGKKIKISKFISMNSEALGQRIRSLADKLI